LRNPSRDAAVRAARVTPADEDIYLQLADLDPADRGLYLRKAAELNPHYPRPWLDRGFIAEVNNDPNEAGLDFEKAARLDRRTAPAWALTNLYFRQGNIKAFYRWAHQYRAYSGGNATGLYRLEWNREPRVATLIKDFSPMTCRELKGWPAFWLSVHHLPISCGSTNY
jgi:hypothetical protein